MADHPDDRDEQRQSIRLGDGRRFDSLRLPSEPVVIGFARNLGRE
jgi:hypothetical protein